MSQSVPDPDALRIAFLIYRGNRHCGGQGIYTRHLTRELANLGHHVEVLSGPPYPEVDEPVVLHELGGIDFYGGRKPMRKTAFLDIRSDIDLLEYLMICTAAFPEPFAFSLRAWRHLARRKDEFDIVHDNQSLAWGLLGIERLGLPVIATLHHPVTVDRELDLAHAETLRRKVSLSRFYGFLRMQKKVAPRLDRVITVSESSKRDITDQMGVPFDKMSVVPVGVDHEVFRPMAAVAKVPGRIMTTASADVPMKGLRYLLEAVAKLRTERDVELTVIGKPRDESGAPRLIRELGIESAVHFVSGVEQERIVELYAEAQVAAVPSLYEGFSLPAIEAMACGVPVVGTTGGAVPEVIGADGETALIVPPKDSGALATAIGRLLDDSALRDRIGNAGRARVMERFTWKACAVGTAEQYRALLDERRQKAPTAG